MEQLRLFTGGHKFHTNNFLHLQRGMLSVLSGISKASIEGGKTVVILDGLITTGASTARTWTSGIVYFADDFYTIPANATPIDIRTYSFDVADTPNANNPVIYRDGVSRDVHVTQELILRADNLGVVQATVIDDAYKFTEQLSKALVVGNTTNPLIDILVSNDILGSIYASAKWSTLVPGTNWTEEKDLRIIQRGPKAELRGRLLSNASSAIVCATGVPVSMRPSTNQVVSCDLYDTSLATIQRGHVVVKTTGNIEFDFAWYSGFAGGDRLVFDSTFYTI